MGWEGLLCPVQGCSQFWVPLFHFSLHCPLLPPSPGFLQVLQQRDHLDFSTFPAWSRLETLILEHAAVCTPNLLPALPRHLQAHCDLPKPQHKSPLPAAMLSPEAHPCGSSLDTEALALKCS